MKLRHIAPLGMLLAVGACVVAPPPGYVAQPGAGKDTVAFQRDDDACHKQAEAAENQPISPDATSSATAALPNPGALYAQCMTAKGNTVTQASSYPPYPTYAYAYAYPYPYAYPYAYPYYPYPAVVGGPAVTFGFGFCCGGFHGYHGYHGYHR